ncbi:hypothetical protein AMTRI_Chr11g158830 [Amborella trichopoda]|uniref:NADH dehydrogenase [ubiquinone] 1 beta subcomplex subunit 3-B n=1 Tax=Amborella trichopoda TaxID=13333 RepID=W1NYM2_AMBTC|nr:NADH dehydrogenase [ubiquinone] 1 beta subcomplex subunit 3-B [Amborella trichopoda]ERM99784.1 hypothetical protein AMTR_s00099p00150850 [Amborella trichopoda]|eukprot:XP_006836931.1 NADH dehydrogenase [ubiquinone] 1 beta subcomplex subunit 3-B [Amborella trichopoda]
MGKPLGSTGEFFRRRDEWRKHPMLGNQLRHATPGLGIAIVAFTIYCVGEAAYNRFSSSSSSSSSSHSHSH